MRYLLAAILLIGCRAAATAPIAGSAATLRSAVAADEIGSTRNARVAVPRDAKSGPLTYFADGMSDAQLRELAAIAPRLHVVVGLSREAALARAAEADGIDGNYATADFLRAAKKLTWIQARSAGVERLASVAGISDPRFVLTNMRSTSGPTIADHAFAMLLSLTRDLAVHLADREHGEWKNDGSGVLEPIALQGRTMFVVGLGGIGGEIAKRAHGFGMHVIATRRSDDPAPEFVERVGKPGDLHAFLAQADVVAICVPLTKETEHSFDRAAFDALKPGSYLINVARGKIVDTAALVDALRSKKLAGACLDVTDPEPLPKDHELWKFPNVVITPHVAAQAALTSERAWKLLRENLRRFDAGEPLLNVVDKGAGY